MTAPFPPSFPVLGTARLVLDALEPGDADALFAVHGNAEAMRYWSTPPWTDADAGRVMVERTRAMFEHGEALRWAIRTREHGRLAGTCTLFAFSTQNRRAEIGYILGREHWGQGLMREALGAVIAYAFDTLELIRIEADTDPRNAGSIRTLESLGFQREGLLRRRWLVGDEVCDSLLFGLLRGDGRLP